MVAGRLLAGAMLLFWSGVAVATSFTATVDRKELFINEHVVLTLALHDSETRLRAEGVSPNIDLTMLTDQFELGIPRADFRFNIERSRGRSTSSITVELFPRRSGRQTIPSFSVDGLDTDPIEISVLDRPEGAAAEVFAVSGVGARRLRVREQTQVFLDLYHRVNLDSARFGGPIETRPRQVELHLLPQENRVETVNGIEYEVTRTAWAISPLTGEDITIWLPDVWVETRQGRQWRLPFSEERIDVTSLPASVPAGTLVGRPAIDIDAPAAARTGHIAPWAITLRSVTALNALPAELPFNEHAGELRIFMDPPQRRHAFSADGRLESVAVYRGSVMPLAPGEYTLPTLVLPWFDPDTERIESLAVAGRRLQVIGAPVTWSGADSGSDTAISFAANGVTAELRIWQTIAALLLLSWLAAAALWWRRRVPVAARYKRGSGLAPATGDLLQDKLLAALEARTLEQGLRTREIQRGVDEELRTVVREVQRRRYHPDAQQGDSDALAQRVDRVVAQLRSDGPVAGNVETDEWSPRAFHRAGKPKATNRV
jgi:hypothetical protein